MPQRCHSASPNYFIDKTRNLLKHSQQCLKDLVLYTTRAVMENVKNFLMSEHFHLIKSILFLERNDCSGFCPIFYK